VANQQPAARGSAGLAGGSARAGEEEGTVGFWRELRDQLRSCWRVLALVAGACAAVLAFVVVLKVVEDVSLGDLTKDPTVVLGGPAYIGVLSQLGVMLWAGVSAVCLFVAWTGRRVGADRELTRFFLASGLLSVLLGLDDGFVLHENLSQPIVFTVYLVLTAAWLWRYLPVIRTTDYLLLLLALASFALSMASDVAGSWESVPHVLRAYFLEDSLKFVALAFWLAYFVRLGTSSITTLVTGGLEHGESRRPGN
jgi:hypothetical protein